MVVSNRRRFASVLALVLIFVIGLGAFRLAPVLNAGSGYAAKNICSGYFLSGFDPQLMVDQALFGASPLLANISFQVDVDAQQVNTRLFGMFPRIATFTPGIGCTLLPSRQSRNATNIKLLNTQSHPTGDDWATAEVTDSVRQKISKLLDAAFSESIDSPPKNTKAIVIVHNARLLTERYAEGVDSSTPLIGWSMTKSITSLLVGILVKDGLLDISEPAAVPSWHAPQDDKKAHITVDHLLRMSSGLAFDEEYGLYSDVTRMLSNESDMAAFAASQPLTSEVGTTWSYASGSSNILAGIVHRAVGASPQHTYEFAQERLFYPLGVRTASMEVDASGVFIGSSYMYASARDWARLGLLCLNQGVWNSQQILPDDWMEYATTPTQTNPANNYGAHFWLNQNPRDHTLPRVFPRLPSDAFAMDGYQGQLVVMVPSEDLVVVRMGFTPQGNHGVEDLVAGVIDAIRSDGQDD